MLGAFFTKCSSRAARLWVLPLASFAAVVLLASLSARANVYWTLPAGQTGDWSVASTSGGLLADRQRQCLDVDDGRSISLRLESFAATFTWAAVRQAEP